MHMVKFSHVCDGLIVRNQSYELFSSIIMTATRKF
jgi:hypothetical protein